MQPHKPPDPNDPETYIPIKDAALEVFKRIDGTRIAAELVSIGGGTPSGVLQFTIWQLVAGGYAWGYKWPNYNDLVLLTKNARAGLSVVSDDGALGASEREEPLIIGVHVKRSGIEAYIKYVQEMQGRNVG